MIICRYRIYHVVVSQQNGVMESNYSSIDVTTAREVDPTVAPSTAPPTGLAAGWIAAIVLLILIIIVAIAVLIWLLCRRCRR